MKRNKGFALDKSFVFFIFTFLVMMFCYFSHGHYIIKMKWGSINLYTFIEVLCLGSIPIIIMVSVNLKRRRLQKRGIKTDAIITSVYKEKKDDTTINMATYEFTSAAGDKYKCKMEIYNLGYKVGDKVQIMYLPDNPSENDEAVSVEPNLGINLFNGLFILLTLAIFYLFFSQEDDGFHYIKKEKKAYIIDYTGETKDVIIPHMRGELEVVGISGREGDVIGRIVSLVKGNTHYPWYGAFQNKGLTSVVIPDSVQEIGSYAFAENQLAEIAIGFFVNISNNAFKNDFVAFYDNQERKGGTFVYDAINRSWSKRENEDEVSYDADFSENSIELLSSSIAMDNKMPPDVKLGVYSMLCEYYIKMEDYDSALFYIEEGIRFAEANKLGTSYSNKKLIDMSTMLGNMKEEGNLEQKKE